MTVVRQPKTSPLACQLLLITLGSLAGAHALAADPVAAAALPVPPHVLTETCAQPVYPPDALAADRTGTVVLTLQVSAEGVATKVDVAQSSGDAQLDAAAAAGMGQCHFNPSTLDGKPIASVASLKYSFKIDQVTTQQGTAQDTIKGVIAIMGVKKGIDAATDRCALQKKDPLVKKAQKVRERWHKDNDAIVAQAAKVQEDIFAAFRAQSADPALADRQIAKSRQTIEALSDRDADSRVSGLENPDESVETDNCRQFSSLALDGYYDLKKLFPEYVEAIASADRPAAKK